MPEEGLSVVGCPSADGCICDLAAKRTDEWLRRYELQEAWSSMLTSAWCINLQTRPDRFLETCKELHSAGLCRLTNFYCAKPATVQDVRKIDPKYSDSPGYFGCWRSHRGVAQQAFPGCHNEPKGGRLCLVMEDDVQFDGRFLRADVLRSMASYLRSPNCIAEIFCLGHIAILGGIPIDMPDDKITVMRVRSSLTHAYIMTERGAHNFLTNGTFGSNGQIGVDQWMLRYMRQEAVFPQIATQRDSWSSNLNGPSIGKPPADGAPHLAFYAKWHVALDIFFCWIAPVGITCILPMLLIAAIVAIYFKSVLIFLLAAILSICILVTGSLALHRRATRLQK